MKRKGRYYCEEQSALYWEVYNEMNGIKTKKNKGPKKGKRCVNVEWLGVTEKQNFTINHKGIDFVLPTVNIKSGLRMLHQDLG